MKNILITTYFIGFILLLFSCTQDEIVIEGNKNDEIEGYWEMAIDVKEFPEAKVILTFDGQFINIQYSEKKGVVSGIVEKYPSSIRNNELEIFHPDDKVLVSRIRLKKNINFSNGSFSYSNDAFKTVHTVTKRTNYFVCRACMAACYAVHDALDIHELDGFCCFFLDC